MESRFTSSGHKTSPKNNVMKRTPPLINIIMKHSATFSLQACLTPGVAIPQALKAKPGAQQVMNLEKKVHGVWRRSAGMALLATI
jgi:hypothetical protein